MNLVTSTGQQIPCEVSCAGDSDGITFYAVDDNGVPLACYFSLTPSGAQVNNGKGTTFVSNKTYWFGNLQGFTSPTPVSAISVGPSFSTVYLPPVRPYLWHGDVQATLLAIPANGSRSRQVQIRATDPRKSNGF